MNMAVVNYMSTKRDQSDYNPDKEVELLILCCRQSLNKRDIACIESLVHTSLDWESLRRMIKEQRVESFVYKGLQHMRKSGRVPEEFKSFLFVRYMSYLRRNVLFVRHCDMLLLTLAEAGIKTIVLKGYMLLKMVYRNVALRPMADLDLLVHKVDLPRVQCLLEGLGFRRQGYRRISKWYEEYMGEVTPFEKPIAQGLQLNIDLHFNICGSEMRSTLTVPFTEIWSDSTQITTPTTTFHTLTHEDYVCHSALRFWADIATGSTVRLFRWIDLAEYIATYGDNFDWGSLWDRSKRRGLDWIVAQDLHIVADKMRVELPSEVHSSIQEHLPQNPCLYFYRSFFDNVVSPNNLSTIWRHEAHTMLLKAMAGRANVLRYFYYKVLPNKAYMQDRYQVSGFVALFRSYCIRWGMILRMGLEWFATKFTKPSIPDSKDSKNTDQTRRTPH